MSREDAEELEGMIANLESDFPLNSPYDVASEVDSLIPPIFEKTPVDVSMDPDDANFSFKYRLKDKRNSNQYELELEGPNATPVFYTDLDYAVEPVEAEVSEYLEE